MPNPTPTPGTSTTQDNEPGGPSSIASAQPHAMVLGALADAVLAVPGVARLAPTVSTSGPALLIRRSATDGIRLLSRAGIAEVDANIATDTGCQVRSVTHQVQATIGQVLTAHGYRTGTVSVSVLAVDAGQPALRR